MSETVGDMIARFEKAVIKHPDWAKKLYSFRTINDALDYLGKLEEQLDLEFKYKLASMAADIYAKHKETLAKAIKANEEACQLIESRQRLESVL